MNRLLALVAVASLGTGCIVSDTCDSHLVWISWPSFTRATDTAYETVFNTCYTDFARMDVWVDGVYAPASCDEGAVAYELPTGTHDIRVEAVDSNDVPIVRDLRQVSISDTCSDQEVPMSPGEAWVNLKYALPGNACDVGFGGTPSFMWFSVRDQIWGRTIAEVSQDSAVSLWNDFTCSAQDGSWFVLPEGSFQLQRVQELVQIDGTVNDTSDVAVSSANCSAQSFSTVSGVDRQVNLTLTEGISCP